MDLDHATKLVSDRSEGLKPIEIFNELTVSTIQESEQEFQQP